MANAAADARAAIHNLTPDQMSSALMCFWVKDPTSFWVAIQSATKDSDG